MKQLISIAKTVMVVMLVNFSMATYATENPVAKEPEDLRSQIADLIENPDLRHTGLQKAEAILHFFVNVKGEVVVLFVETSHVFVDNYLKQRLNYKPLKDVSAGRYRMKVTIKDKRYARSEKPESQVSIHPHLGSHDWEGFSADVRKSIKSKIDYIHKQ